jgi:flavin reductase (DIM6/NTAB) family NADH-FMN oxidoreductase RutF
MRLEWICIASAFGIAENLAYVIVWNLMPRSASSLLMQHNDNFKINLLSSGWLHYYYTIVGPSVNTKNPAFAGFSQ